MSIYAVFVLMIFAHIADDFYLQGKLAFMKQRYWWSMQYKDANDEKLYGKDYIASLIIHALSWSIMISFPIFFASAWNPHFLVYVFIFVNATIHAIVDDLKANKGKINLCDDQIIHFAQIILTWVAWTLWG